MDIYSLSGEVISIMHCNQDINASADDNTPISGRYSYEICELKSAASSRSALRYESCEAPSWAGVATRAGRAGNGSVGSFARLITEPDVRRSDVRTAATHHFPTNPLRRYGVRSTYVQSVTKVSQIHLG